MRKLWDDTIRENNQHSKLANFITKGFNLYTTSSTNWTITTSNEIYYLLNLADYADYWIDIDVIWKMISAIMIDIWHLPLIKTYMLNFLLV